MTINKNDCLDCANCIPMNQSINNTVWICNVTKERIKTDKYGLIQVMDKDCNNFKYED